MLAYATTIHKAQGSEYPAVVIPLATQHYAMLARNLLYTGVTRGKRLVVGRGQPQGAVHGGQERLRTPALVQAARMAAASRRWPVRQAPDDAGTCGRERVGNEL